jgi:hypothetical protein
LVRNSKKPPNYQFIIFDVLLEINQKVQNSTVGASKVHSNSDVNGIERANSTGGRECMKEKSEVFQTIFFLF